MIRLLATLLPVAVAATGCGPVALGDRFAAYRAEIEAALGHAAAPAAPAEDHPIGLPRRRERQLPVEERRIRMLDFLALQGCPLGALVGARNSPLGRVMQPVQRLDYEIELLHVVDSCLVGLSDDRAERIRARLAGKRAELPAHRFHAVWNEAPMERYLGVAATPVLGVAEGDDVASLVALRHALEADAAPGTSAAIERALERLRDEVPLGASLRALDDAAHALDRVATLVHVASPDACGPGAARLVRVFETRYLPLQAPLAVADRHAREALAELDRIYRETRAGIDAPLAAMDRYHASVLDPDADQGLWRRYRTAIERHAAAWAPLLERCGPLAPAGAEAG